MTKCSMRAAIALVIAVVLAVPAAATPPGQDGLLVGKRGKTRSGVNLWVSNPDGSAARRVFARARRFDFLASFSPTDPTLLFFTRARNAPFSADIVSGNLASGEVTTVVGARSDDVSPTFSPDGSRIAYFAVRRPRRIREDRPPPPERSRLPTPTAAAPAISQRASFRKVDRSVPPRRPNRLRRGAPRRRPGPQNRDRDHQRRRSGRRVLTRYGGVDEVNPNFMPDGQSIVFEQLRERGRRSDIAMMNPDGSGVRKILATRRWETNPIPSPDGTRIAFTSDRDRPGRERLNRGFELYTMAVDGTDIVRLTNNRQLDFFPDGSGFHKTAARLGNLATATTKGRSFSELLVELRGGKGHQRIRARQVA